MGSVSIDSRPSATASAVSAGVSPTSTQALRSVCECQGCRDGNAHCRPHRKRGHWTGITRPDEFAEKDPDWIARLLGIKHTLGGDWMEFPNPTMNDPANIVMMTEDDAALMVFSA
jgi:hypothetical protein